MIEQPKGNCEHKASVSSWHYVYTDNIETKEEHLPVIWLGTDEDTYYAECFHSRFEINIFIQRLKRARDKAWPKFEKA